MAALELIAKILKWALIVVNVIIFLFACVIIILAIMALLESTNLGKMTGSSSFTVIAVCLLLIGLAIASVAYLGCCGAYNESKLKLTIFACIMILFAIFFFVGGGMALNNSTKLISKVEVEMKGTMKDYGPKNPRLTKTWDSFQKRFKCCGTAGSNDWIQQNSNFATKPPASCCKSGNPDCTYGSGINEEGCVKSVKNLISGNSKPMAYLGIVVAVAIILSFIFAIVLCILIGQGHGTYD